MNQLCKVLGEFCIRSVPYLEHLAEAVWPLGHKWCPHTHVCAGMGLVMRGGDRQEPGPQDSVVASSGSRGDLLKGAVVLTVMCTLGEERGPGNWDMASSLVPGTTWVA